MTRRAVNSRVRRRLLLVSAIQIQIVSLLWIVIEASLGLLAALASHALSTSVFSVDSGIELISGFIILARLLLDIWSKGTLPQWVERTASGVVGCCLLALAAWISLKAGQAMAIRQAPVFSNVALWVALSSSIMTPWLAVRKRRLGERLGSAALIGDAACTMTCAMMAWTLLIGLLLQWTGNLWWVDPLAASAIVIFVIREGLESVSVMFGGNHAHTHGRSIVE